jgi:hypothetical protein
MSKTGLVSGKDGFKGVDKSRHGALVVVLGWYGFVPMSQEPIFLWFFCGEVNCLYQVGSSGGFLPVMLLLVGRLSDSRSGLLMANMMQI